MEQRTILIVEDELIIAEYLSGIVRRLGHEVAGVAASAAEAQQCLEEQAVDLVLLDVMLAGEQDGIDLATSLRRDHQVPFVFVTSLSDAATVERAAETQPQGYLVKPFGEPDVRAALALAFARSPGPPAPDLLQHDSLFVRDRKQFVKINFNELLWLQADGNYTVLQTAGSRYTVYYTLKQVERLLPTAEFVRVHRSYLVAIRAVSAFGAQGVTIRDTVIPVGRSYQQALTQRLNLLGSL